MESDWYRWKAGEIGRAAKAAKTETERAKLENDQRNWLAIADNIDAREARKPK